MANIQIDVEGNAAEQLAQLEKQLGKSADSVGKMADAAKAETSILESTEAAVERASTAYKLLTKARSTSIISKAEAAAMDLVRSGYNALLNPLGEVILRYPKLAHVMEDVGLKAVAQQAALKAIGEETVSLSVKLSAAQVNAILWRTSIEKTVAVLSFGTGVLTAFQVQVAALNFVLDRTGKQTDELGNVTTNLDRIRSAQRGLREDLAAPFQEIAKNLVEWWNTPLPIVEKTIKRIDEVVTRSSKQYIENINLLRDQLNPTHRLEEANARLEAQREREKAGYEGIKNVNDILAAREASRARAAEINSLKTIEATKNEEHRVREKAAEYARAGASREAVEKYLLSQIDAIEARRTAITRSETDKRDAITKASADFQAAMEKSISDAAAAEYRRRSELAEKQFEAIREAKKKAVEEEKKAEQERFDQEQRWREEGQQLERERLFKELEDRKKAALAAVQVEQQKQQALKAARGEALEKAGVKGEDLLGMAKRTDVLRNLQEQARARAQQQTGQQNQELRARGDFDPEARAQYERLQRKAQEAAMRGAARDFNMGRTDPQALAQAQAQAAQKQLGALQQQGKLSGDSVQAMAELIQATAQQQATTQQLQRQVDQMAAAAKQLNANAGQQRQAAQRGVVN